MLSCVRLPLISLPDLLNVVRPCEVVSADVILDAIKARSECRDADLQYRGYQIAEENVASPRHGAQVLQGELKTNLLDGDVHNYDMEKGFTRHRKSRRRLLRTRRFQSRFHQQILMMAMGMEFWSSSECRYDNLKASWCKIVTFSRNFAQCIVNHMRMLLWDKDMRAYR